MNPTDLLQALGGCLQTVDLSHGLAFSLFLAGLVGGATHCVGMCGPFVVVQAREGQKLCRASQLPYHLGRITTYTGMAVLISAIFSAAFLYWPVRSYIAVPLLVLAGSVFLVSAFPRLQAIFPWAANLKVSFLPERWLSKGLQALSGDAGILKQYGMGVLLGFMPCGLVMSALLASSAAPSPIGAAMAMAAFGLGTVPSLVMTAIGAQKLQSRFPSAMHNVTTGLMAWNAIWLFALAGMMLN